MPRESADDKLTRIVSEQIAAALRGQRDQDEESKDPNWARMRKVIREEVGSILGDILNDKGDRRRAPREESDDAEEDRKPFSLFG